MAVKTVPIVVLTYLTRQAITEDTQHAAARSLSGSRWPRSC